jgi:hypothetical protein
MLLGKPAWTMFPNASTVYSFSIVYITRLQCELETLDDAAALYTVHSDLVSGALPGRSIAPPRGRGRTTWRRWRLAGGRSLPSSACFCCSRCARRGTMLTSLLAQQRLLIPALPGTLEPALWVPQYAGQRQRVSANYS